MLLTVEKRTCPSQENKRGSTKMRDPAREKHARRGPTRRHTGIDAHMINGHQDHGDAADKIDGADPGCPSSGYVRGGSTHITPLHLRFSIDRCRLYSGRHSRRILTAADVSISTNWNESRSMCRALGCCWSGPGTGQ